MARYPQPLSITRAAIIGTGTIGGGWAAVTLARGLKVTAWDPGDAAEEKLRALLNRARPYMAEIGLELDQDLSSLRFVPSLEEALDGAQFVQESAPDREDLKVDLLRQIDGQVPDDVVIASSSSTFLPSALARAAARPERIIVGHPFAPSYLIPLVEVVGGAQTDPAAMDAAEAYYQYLGKRTVRLKKEIQSYVANRLQYVIRDEVMRLVADGICDFEDADQALVFGPGLRWAFMGSTLTSHFTGGIGGLRATIDHFGWRGPPQLEAPALETVDALTEGRSMEELEAWRDENLVSLLRGLNTLYPQRGGEQQ